MRNSKHFYVDVNTIDRNEFLFNKINNRQYLDFGNFNKILMKSGITIEEYWNRYYPEHLPKCLESGLSTNNKIDCYWNRWVPLRVEYKHLLRQVNCTINVLRRLKLNGYDSKYLTIEYWSSQNLKLSEIIKKIRYFLNQDSSLYLRFFDEWYLNDNYTWREEAKQNYIDSILNENAWVLKPSISIDGLLQRGMSLIDAKKYHDSWSKNFTTCFRDSKYQSENNRKKLLKYSKQELRSQSVRCIEYWMKRGYSYAESEKKIFNIQASNTIENIMKYQNCTKEEAEKIQFEIYRKRADTFSKKTSEELYLINSKKDSSSFDYCLRKCNFNIDNAKILYGDLKEKKVFTFGKASKESLKCFIPFYKILRKNGINKTDIFWGISGSKEYFIKTDDDFFMYDFTIRSKKIIVEYDGIYWHDDKEKDEIKQKAAEKNGFKLYRIKSELTNEEKTDILVKILNEDLQIKNSNWQII